MTDRDARLDALLDRQSIHEVLMRNARGADRADAELLASCYHEDAIEEHGNLFKGNAHEYIIGAMARAADMPTIAHYLCNISIELLVDIAHVETYVLTFARLSGMGKAHDTLTGARICDRFEKREGIWKIAHRKAVFDWNRDMVSAEGWCLGLFKPEHPDMVLGRRDRQDLSYLRL